MVNPDPPHPHDPVCSPRVAFSEHVLLLLDRTAALPSFSSLLLLFTHTIPRLQPLLPFLAIPPMPLCLFVFRRNGRSGFRSNSGPAPTLKPLVQCLRPSAEGGAGHQRSQNTSLMHEL